MLTEKQARVVLQWVFEMAAIAEYDGDDIEEAAIEEAGRDLDRTSLGRTNKLHPSQEVGGRYDRRNELDDPSKG